MGKSSILYLENGKMFNGVGFGFRGETIGEIVFNTSMTGYQEILTDPSYHSQVVLMTYPHIGNYGINSKDNESNECYVKGFIAREFCPYPSNFISEMTLEEYLIQNKVVGISDIDTRELTRIVRNEGAQRCIISSKQEDVDKLKHKLEMSPEMKGNDLTLRATCKEIYRIGSKKNKKKLY